MTCPSYVMFLTSNGGRFGQPVALLRLVIQRSEHALLGQLANGDTDIPLHCRRRIAAGDAVQGRGVFRLRSDGCIIHPGAASLVVFLREHGDRSEFAAAGPPMHDIRVLRDRLAARSSVPASAVATAMVLNIGSSRLVQAYMLPVTT